VSHLLAICTFFGALVFAVVPAGAQEFPSYLPTMEMDVVELRESSEGHLAELFYANSAMQASSGVDRVLEWNGIQVHVKIIINGHGMSEVLTVTPLDPAHIAFPSGPIPVRDGEEVVVQIMLPMF
jgi:hypothetical protein